MEKLRSNYKTIILISLLVIGLITVVTLVQKQQTIKSKATEDITTRINITNPDGTPIKYNGGNTFTTNSQEVTITIPE